MPYIAPFVDAAGLHIPTYNDIFQDNLAKFIAIYGPNQYLQPDSAVYQLLSIISLKQSDTMQAVQLGYNQSSPASAVGTGLDRIVKMNGIARLPYGFSSAVLTLVGTSGTVINNGIAQDENGNQWRLPNVVTIPLSGTIDITAICSTPGAVSAEAGSISIIATPVGGWQSVTNSDDAIVGAPVEADSGLRARQSISVALPSLTRLASTTAAVLAIPGVTRVNPLENPTNIVDMYGNPPHSVTMTVEGASDLDVATAIYLKHGIGCFMNGTTNIPVTDPYTWNVTNVGFYRPTYVEIYVGIVVRPLSGFTSATADAIQQAVVNFLNKLAIGELVAQSSLYGAALSVIPDPTKPTFAIESLTLDIAASSLFDVEPDAGGTGYVVGDVLTVVQAGASGGTVTVAAVDGTGAITALQKQATTPGTGYSVATGLATTGGSGNSATVNINAVAPTATSDITLLFYQVAQGSSDAVAVITTV